jgi:hypothetical protein
MAQCLRNAFLVGIICHADRRCLVANANDLARRGFTTVDTLVLIHRKMGLSPRSLFFFDFYRVFFLDQQIGLLLHVVVIVPEEPSSLLPE